MRRVLTLLAAAVAAVSMLAATAVASGPAPPGKQLIKLNCTGLGPITVSVQRGQNSKGAGQIVGMKGHGIPVKIVFTLTDLTTTTLIGLGGAVAITTTMMTTRGATRAAATGWRHCSWTRVQ